MRPAAGGDLIADVPRRAGRRRVALPERARASTGACAAGAALPAFALVVVAARARSPRTPRCGRCAPTAGTRWPPASATRSSTCRRCGCPTPASTTGCARRCSPAAALLLLVGVCLALLPRPRPFGAAVALGDALRRADHRAAPAPSVPRRRGLRAAARRSCSGPTGSAPREVAAGGRRSAPWRCWPPHRRAAHRLGHAVGRLREAGRVAAGRQDRRRSAGTTATGRCTGRATGGSCARVRSRGDLYLKTVALERFDGVAWAQAARRAGRRRRHRDRRRPPGLDAEDPRHDQGPEVRSSSWAPARPSSSAASSKDIRGATPGTFETAAKPLRRGDAYDAIVYTPQPVRPAELHDGGHRLPVARAPAAARSTCPERGRQPRRAGRRSASRRGAAARRRSPAAVARLLVRSTRRRALKRLALRPRATSSPAAAPRLDRPLRLRAQRASRACSAARATPRRRRRRAR